MHLSEIIDGLNDNQSQSVVLDNTQNALILAGAGSGKTRVLTHRIAYLVTQKNVPIDAILAVTFTNKASKEMRERLEVLLRRPIRTMWVGTFHGLAHRLLRTHAAEANLSPQFQILDQQDQYRIVKRLMKENSIDESKFPVRKVQWFINQQKDEGIRPGDIDAGHNYFVKKSLEVFGFYENHCNANGLIDFAELLVRSYELLRNNSELLTYYQTRFQHILVDEFQDTNTVQYRWIQQLFNGKNNVFCVGDDDQSIYGWRGAKIENITKLSTDFAPIQTIRLEQNYRSTGYILKASNALIANNKNRMGKSLWTDSGDGDLIDLYEARTEIDEADYVVGSIQKIINNGIPANQCAILYRSNAQSRAFEERLIKYNVPYIIYGGLRFFERAEIKDALCYLRLMENTEDSVAFERIVNFPTRGIGAATIEKVREHALMNQTGLFQAAISMAPTLPTRAANALIGFMQLIEEMQDHAQNLDLSEKIGYLIKKSGLFDYYSNDKTDKAGSKPANLEELIAAAEQYTHEEDSEMNEVTGFISLASLDSSGDSSAPPTQNVQLMTIHSAKGLEFPYVFLAGLEEDLFPSRQSKEEPHLLDEERRLCYVGMTRAMKKLTLSFAIKRFLHGQSNYAYPSRFLSEFPEKHLNQIKQKYGATPQNYQKDDVFNQDIKPQANGDLSIGRTVKHAKFGFGTVLNFEGDGESARVQVKFKTAGTKWLISAYANLEFI
ncbi:DNA helicase II [Bathymodiolus septemdierum thioautotrophic gill symbiont]|uniref:DNA 3'-5' helicase n=1 Tax=endosymbiont of Bathymodiolus septemdierum str. Myojin knoll TaxID=1303921 RepID=A0A0P0URW7_9GAMM|nr:DNA helicase II [Bathymodiolus septemdierum thioautotrophic gill symbiont]BAS67594.1 DNA helicase II / ATP-dependent DNA helicase PcrA [endosymbiont of Bathymodiolus septemdierum str. Myojin knoll]